LKHIKPAAFQWFYPDCTPFLKLSLFHPYFFPIFVIYKNKMHLLLQAIKKGGHMDFTFRNVFFALALGLLLTCRVASAGTETFPVVDTGQVHCYGNFGKISCTDSGKKYSGQDAQYRGNAPAYRDNGDGTVTDLVTGLIWQKGLGEKKVSLEEALKMAETMTLGGHSDWRVPTIKELYSLIDFRGNTGSAGNMYQEAPANAVPFINTDYFDFTYGNVADGERYIDAQWLSCTEYVSTTMGSMETLFGVNFADGRIKGYGYRKQGTTRDTKKFFVRFVRGNAYGENQFVDNGDGTVTDTATGLTWMQVDSGRAMSWQEALSYAEALDHAGHDDWRLPNAKELQSIVDYSRSPDTTGSAAIDPVFQTTAITNEADQKDFPFFWTATTHLDGPQAGSMAVYVAFGRAMGRMNGQTSDVHGAGAQRSDPKTGQAGLGHGPQGDAQRIANHVRCVRGGAVALEGDDTETKPSDADRYPEKIRISDNLPGDSSSRRQQRSSTQMQTGRGSGAPAGFVDRLDKDGDARVSRSEFDGPTNRFDLHDANHDGYLTDEEAPKGARDARPPQ
jgi:hypothetical protein